MAIHSCRESSSEMRLTSKREKNSWPAAWEISRALMVAAFLRLRRRSPTLSRYSICSARGETMMTAPGYSSKATAGTERELAKT